MKHLNYKRYLPIAVALLATSCVNDDYDLSDIDTTSRVSVNDLTIPVNIDAITLGDIISPDEDSKIQSVTIGGREFYALTEKGEFNSDPIHIAKVVAPAPTLSPTEAYLDLLPDFNLPMAQGIVLTSTYKIKDMGNDLNYNAGHIDDAIVELGSVKADMTLNIKLELLDLSFHLDNVKFTNVVMQLPRGLYGVTTSEGSYNPATGEWSISNLDITTVSIDLSLKARGVNFKQAGVTIDAAHALKYDGEFRIKSGEVTLTTTIDGVTLPASLHFKASYDVSSLEATAFTGVINYKVGGIDIAPISLSDIPDFLNGDGTNIRLANPQLYLQVNNPVADNDLNCTTGLKLTAERDGGAPLAFTLDKGSFTIGHSHGVAGPYNFVLAPNDNDLNTPADYSTDLNFVEFTSLTDLLATPAGYPVSGLPGQIAIDLVDPQIPTSSVTDFALGRDLEGVHGKYEVVAPLALASGSTIIYTHTADGWSSEDLDAVTITNLTLTAKVNNKCPLGAYVVVWPIDVNGNRIEGAEIKSNVLTYSPETPEEFKVELTGTIRHLDGVVIEAHVNSEGDQPLTKNDLIVFTNIRATVSGYYEKKL